MATERCSTCAGHGLVQNHANGEPMHCPECDGSGRVQARDLRGRFTNPNADKDAQRVIEGEDK